MVYCCLLFFLPSIFVSVIISLPLLSCDALSSSVSFPHLPIHHRMWVLSSMSPLQFSFLLLQPPIPSLRSKDMLPIHSNYVCFPTTIFMLGQHPPSSHSCCIHIQRANQSSLPHLISPSQNVHSCQRTNNDKSTPNNIRIVQSIWIPVSPSL